ncbi:8-oxoguanine DNA glycosylase isoform X1 [Osmia lignaria lignaria]|uniref:8-oxoguanine DNA glycosylase isoform X1 n=1 Tax=Osmia lignaria lignaria TaxID=1437193 RepID=UPI0014794E40|nr:N-glycosylase/DNA lyase isoform X1 [Osmia lignaria]
MIKISWNKSISLTTKYCRLKGDIKSNSTISLNLLNMKMEKNEIKTKQGKIACPLSELDLGITLKGGQSFRWFSHDDGYRGVFNKCVWTLKQNDTHLFYVVQGLLTDSINYDQTLSEYFRLDVSLNDLCKNWSTVDQHFEKSMNETNGVRILNQDVVENVFSFICSSNNNIQRISGMIEKLCALFGEKICTVDDKDYYTFPSIEPLTGENIENQLREEKFGYRAGYIADTAKCLLKHGGAQWLLNLHKKNNTSYIEARKQLITLPGIGPKVADCVCLMSLGHLDAIPVDTHIFQIARANYLPHLGQQKTVTPKIHEEISNHLRELWGPLAGWAQAIVFCAKINNAPATASTKKRKNSRNKKTVSSKSLKKQ